MAQITPKQIDWSQSISGSLVPYTGSGQTVSDFTLGSPSQSWGDAYISGLTVSGAIGAQDGNFTDIVVTNSTTLSGSTSITGSTVMTGSLKISGSIELDGTINIDNLGSLGDRNDELVMDLGGFF